MIKLTKFVIKHSWLTISVILLITVFFGYSIKNIKVDPDITSSLPRHIPAKLFYDKMNEVFPSKDFILIALESDSIFSLKVVREIFDLTEKLEEFPEVYSVMSPTNVKLITGSDEGMIVKEILSDAPETQKEAIEFKRKLLNSELPIDNLIAKDKKMAGIMVFLKNTVKPEDGANKIVKFIHSYNSPVPVFVTGKPVLTYYLGRGMARDMSLLFPAVILLIIIILWISFKSARGVLLPLSVVVISNIWTIGTMSLLGVPISHSTNILPILLASVAVADGIHIINRYYDYARLGFNVKDSVISAMKELNSPVILTSVTSAIGFLALNSSDVGSVGELGVFTAYGILAAMVFSLTFIPAALSFMKTPKRILHKTDHGLLTKLAISYGNLLVNKRKTLIGFIMLIILFSVVGIPLINVENNSIDNFPDEHPAKVAYLHINKHFAGTTYLSIIFEGNEPDAIKYPKVLRDMLKLESYLKTLPHIGGTLSLADFIKRINKVMHAESEEYNIIPPDTVMETGYDWVEENGQWKQVPVTFKTSGKDLIAQYLQLYEMSGKPGDFSNMVDYNYQTARINAFLDTESSNVLRDIDRKVRDYIKKNIKSIKVELTGTSELFLAINDLVVTGQFKSILISLLLVIAVTSLAFRSLWIGILNSIPLFFAMLFNFGFMGWARIDLNIVTMLTSSIAIGVGVDYAVHYIHRYKLQLNTHTEEESTKDTIVAAGIPIFLNALTVGLGFSIMLFSIFMGVKNMGLLITIAMFTSSFGALTILPVYFLTFKPRILKKIRSKK